MEKLLHFIGTIFAMLTVVIFVGCNVVNHSEGLGESGTVYNLQVKSRQELLMGNGRMAMIDSFLIIVSSGPDDICRIYDIYDNNKEICAYGKTGNGPGEFIQPLLTYAWNNEFGLNEMNKQELAILAIDKPNTGEAIVVHEEKRLKASYQKKKANGLPPAILSPSWIARIMYPWLVWRTDGSFRCPTVRCNILITLASRQ